MGTLISILIGVALMEGYPRRQTPHPSAMLLIASTLSHKGRGEFLFEVFSLLISMGC